MSIFQSLVWTCDICGHSDIVYQEIDPRNSLSLIAPDKTKYMLIQFDTQNDSKLLCEQCAHDLVGTMNLNYEEMCEPWNI